MGGEVDEEREFYQEAFRAFRIAYECAVDELMAHFGLFFEFSELKWLGDLYETSNIVELTYQGRTVLLFQLEAASRRMSCQWTRLNSKH